MNRRQARKRKARAEKYWRLLKREIIAEKLHEERHRVRQARKWWIAYRRWLKAERRKRREDECTD